MPDLSKATPRPWVGFKYEDTVELLPAMRKGSTGVRCDISTDERDANAALIVKAVNLHDELVAALKDADWFLSQCATRIAQQPNRWPDGGPEVMRIHDAVRAVLAKAEAINE